MDPATGEVRQAARALQFIRWQNTVIVDVSVPVVDFIYVDKIVPLILPPAEQEVQINGFKLNSNHLLLPYMRVDLIS